MAVDFTVGLGSSSSLSDEEQERARRFHRPEDASRWTAARSALRQILGSYLDLEPSALRFVLVAKDKPTLELPAGEELHFNLSHSRGLGLLAVSRSLELGVDIEYSSSELDHPAIAERVFPPELSASLAALSGEQRSAASDRTWVRAEAAAKCSGTGLVESGQHSMRDLRLVDIDVPEGYAGALALRERWGAPPGTPHASHASTSTAFPRRSRPSARWADFTAEHLEELDRGPETGRHRRPQPVRLSATEERWARRL